MQDTSLPVVVATCYPVAEIIPRTIQGEGPRSGTQAIFVRFQFCDGDGKGHRCESWCDTKYTWDKNDPNFLNYVWRTGEQILDQVSSLLHATKPVNTSVVFTGGNPLLYLDQEIIDKFYNFDIYIETQGTIWKPCVKSCKGVVVSPKPPSSGLTELSDELLATWVLSENVTFKIVIFDKNDFVWATKIYNKVHAIAVENNVEPSKFYLQAGTAIDGDAIDNAIKKYRWLVENWVASGEMPLAVALPQLHVLVWGRRKGV